MTAWGRLRKRLEYHYVGSQESPQLADSPSSDWALDSETRYIYDGMRVIQERNGTNNTPTVSYTRGHDLSGSLEGAGGIGGLLARSSGYSSGNWSTHNFYHADANGNVIYLVSSSQTLAAFYRYDPWGNLLTAGGTLATPNVYRFSSKEIHVNSGLYNFGYRFYEPNMQRWINRDPLSSQRPQHSRLWGNSLKIELEQSANLFNSFRNDPVSHHDPDGQFLPIACVVIAAAIICEGGCSNAPEPLDQDGCWASTDPRNLHKLPGQGAGKPIGCLARQTGCDDCCEQKYPINGGDPKKYA